MTGARVLSALLLLAGLQAGRASDLMLLVGSAQTPDRTDRAMAWQVDYRVRVAPRLSLGGGYVNEGHLDGHKRDGLALQGWLSLPLLRHHLSLDFGAGLYGFADTDIGTDSHYENTQGTGRIFSVSTTFRPSEATLGRLQLNRIHVNGGPDSNQTLLGVGCRLGRSTPGDREEGEGLERLLPDEITIFAGQSVLNSIEDQKGLAFGAEIRKSLMEHCDWTFTWLYEGDPQVVRRNGLGSQVWLVGTYLPGKFTLGVGGGVYVFLDEKLPRTGSVSRDNLGGLVSLTAAYRFLGPWGGRAIWNRVLTHNSRDSDDFVLGLSYRM
nr:hypothetical protein [uncultured Holophaga sp.]